VQLLEQPSARLSAHRYADLTLSGFESPGALGFRAEQLWKGFRKGGSRTGRIETEETANPQAQSNRMIADRQISRQAQIKTVDLAAFCSAIRTGVTHLGSSSVNLESGAYPRAVFNLELGK